MPNKGKKTGALGIVRDITDHKRAEEELIKTKDYLNNVIESSLDCIIVTDTKERITRVNKSFLNLLGCEESEVVGKQLIELFLPKQGTYESTTGKLIKIDEEYRKSIKVNFLRLVRASKVSNLEFYVCRNDNKNAPARS